MWKSNAIERISRRSLSHFIEDDRFLGSAEFENPTWRGVIRLVTGAATLTGIDPIGQLDIGMALATEARNRFRFSQTHCVVSVV